MIVVLPDAHDNDEFSWPQVASGHHAIAYFHLPPRAAFRYVHGMVVDANSVACRSRAAQRLLRSGRWLTALAIAAGSAACATLGSEDGTADDSSTVRAQVVDWFGGATAAVQRFFGDADYRDAARDTANAWWRETTDALHDNSIERLASLADESRQVSDWAQQYESLAPYGAWLAARADYFEAAQAALDSVPAPAPAAPAPRPKPRVRAQPQPAVTPPPKRPLPPRTTPTPAPPPTRPTPVSNPPPNQPVAASRPPAPPAKPPPPLPAPPPAIESRRQEAAAQPAYWRKKVATHPQPARAKELAPKVAAAFRAEGVPESLIWLAEVESSFDPDARSPAGAVGLFQLMPATARSLGLKTSPADERRDPTRSAGAAARYLAQLYRRFGSWPLTLAAYNAGESRVSRLLKSTGTRDYDAIKARLPLETRMYVPRVLATVELRSGVSADAIPAATKRQQVANWQSSPAWIWADYCSPAAALRRAARRT